MLVFTSHALCYGKYNVITKSVIGFWSVGIARWKPRPEYSNLMGWPRFNITERVERKFDMYFIPYNVIIRQCDRWGLSSLSKASLWKSIKIKVIVKATLPQNWILAGNQKTKWPEYCAEWHNRYQIGIQETSKLTPNRRISALSAYIFTQQDVYHVGKCEQSKYFVVWDKRSIS